MRLRLAEGRWQLIEREKNLQALSDLNMLVSDIPSVLRRITKQDYCDGPLQDDKGRPFQRWVFGPKYKGETLHVKLTLNRQGWLLCMSRYAIPSRRQRTSDSLLCQLR